MESLCREGWGADGNQPPVSGPLVLWGHPQWRELRPAFGKRCDGKNSEIWTCLCWQKSQVWTGQRGMTTGGSCNSFLALLSLYFLHGAKNWGLESGFGFQLCTLQICSVGQAFHLSKPL